MTTRPETKATRILRAASQYEFDRHEPTFGSTPGFPDTTVWVRGMAIPVEIKRGVLTELGIKVELTPVQKIWWRRAKETHKIVFGAVSTRPDSSHWMLLDARTFHALGNGGVLVPEQHEFPVAEFDKHLRVALTCRAVRS